jgi:tRNA 2-thiouridine synthesizing protein A
VGRPQARGDAEWDAGDTGCGELVLELRFRLDTLKGGQIMKLIARDPGAPADIPAWCRMTGHRLVGGRPPVYLIQRKED